MNASRWALTLALVALSAVFWFWFQDSKLRNAALLFFALPPLLLAAGVLLGWRKAGYWAGVIGLFWFSHGVMEGYTLPAERVFALSEVALSIVIILAANWPGMSARFGKKKTAGDA
jgi:uncharacterized membrane protein